VELKTIYLGYINANTHFNANTVLRLEGSNDNTSWTTLGNGYNFVTAVPGVIGTINANTFTVTQNSGKYLYYRIFWVSGGGINNTGYANEVYFETPPTYQASLNPKISCTTDTDADGKLNHLDTDSDADGCSDALEAGATTSTTPNFQFSFVSPANDANNNGLIDSKEGATAGTINYVSNYGSYAVDAALNVCLDSDGDGVVDVIDLDDDNDGILDSVESQDCENAVLITPASATSSPVFGGNIANFTIDGSGFFGSGLSATVTAPSTLADSWLLKEPLTSGFIDYTLAASSNLGGVVLWAPDATNYGGGDAPPKDFTVDITFNDGHVFTTGVYTTAQPNGSGSLPGAQVFYFPRTFKNVTKLKLNFLNGWYDISNNSLNQVSTAGQTVSAAYNMSLGEFRALCGSTDMDTDGDGVPNRLDLD
jgi:hypothetical protein